MKANLRQIIDLMKSTDTVEVAAAAEEVFRAEKRAAIARARENRAARNCGLKVRA